ncbi:aspartyl protease family protein [Sphingomonas sp. NSE70-1]|uniref:Aspartyl protease family protein n=1 Tax=Sphingomonas caseinilyticus TaxID=2908205 RepID=A0ABT0RW69_9SPHN|nr:aspartyl protease family protein [Sphingomonas caseinilyticus]MCL6699257.1 aspartyl protease family protein [Sphingomonas caseinilyticus]
MKSYKRIALGALLIAAAAGVAAQVAEPPIATPTVTAVAERSATIPFELYRGNRMFLKGSINGVETAMVLDSGAGVTTLDKAFAQKIGLTNGQKISAFGTGGEQDAELFQNVTIEAGNLKLSGATVVAIDLSQIAKGVGRPMPVILGREILVNSVVSIDFDRKEMSLSPSKGFVAPAGATEVKLKRDETLHYMPVSLAGLPPVDAAFDLGNGGALSISKEYHEAHREFAALPPATSLSGGVGGLHEMKMVTVPKVDMAGFSFEGVPANLGALPEGPYKDRANVGIQMFKPFRLTLDLGNDRLWLQRNGKPAEFTKDRSGMFTLLEGDHFNVLHVSPGSPADRAGFKKGDKLVAIGGERVGPAFFAGPQASWFRGAPGTEVALTKADGATVKVTLANYY